MKMLLHNPSRYVIGAALPFLFLGCSEYVANDTAIEKPIIHANSEYSKIPPMNINILKSSIPKSWHMSDPLDVYVPFGSTSPRYCGIVIHFVGFIGGKTLPIRKPLPKPFGCTEPYESFSICLMPPDYTYPNDKHFNNRYKPIGKYKRFKAFYCMQKAEIYSWDDHYSDIMKYLKVIDERP